MKSEKSGLRKKDIQRVTVIGAGFSGLVSALLLARNGIDVVLIERNTEIAPLLRNYSLEGFEINHGFHYIGGYYPGSALHQSFENLGIASKLTPISFNEKGFDLFSGVLANQQDLVLPIGIQQVRQTLEQSFPGNTAVLAEYFGLLEDVFQNFSFFNIESYFYKVTPSLTGISLTQFLEERQAHPHLISFLDAYSQMLLGMNGREISLLSHLLGVGAYFLSVHTFKGGGGAIIDALEAEVTRAGVQVLTHHEVTQIHYEARRVFSGLQVRSLETGQENEIKADACISTIHPKRLLRLLQGGLAGDIYSRRIADYSDTRAVCLFHLAVDSDVLAEYTCNSHCLSRDANGELQHQITLLPDFTGFSSAGSNERILTIMTTAWCNDLEQGCPERLGGSCNSAHLLPDSKYGPVQASYLDRVEENMRLQLEQHFPQLKGRYRVVHRVSPCHFERLTATWDGSIYGVKCSVSRLGMSTIGPVKGLFLAGQSITAPGIFGTLVSAYLACNRITGNLIP